MSVSKPRMLQEQITGKPNLIWEAREGLPKEVTTKLRPEGWVGIIQSQRGEWEGKGEKGEYKWVLVFLSVPGPVPRSLHGEGTWWGEGTWRGETGVLDLGESPVELQNVSPAPVPLFPAHPSSPLSSRRGTPSRPQPPSFWRELTEQESSTLLEWCWMFEIATLPSEKRGKVSFLFFFLRSFHLDFYFTFLKYPSPQSNTISTLFKTFLFVSITLS